MHKTKASKKEVIAAVAASLEKSKAEVTPIVASVFEQIALILKENSSLSIPGFGTFKVVHRKERNGRNPKTGETMKIPAKDAIVFKPSKSI